MKRVLAPLVPVAAALVFAACTDPGQGTPKEKPAAPAPVAAAGAKTSARSPDESEKTAMLEALKAETDPARKAWLLHGAGQPEAAALAASIAAIFKEAGWPVDSREATGIMLKPGVAVLSADEEPPAWVNKAIEAMQASGLDPKLGTAYRPYYLEKKKENPAWPGIPMTDDQVFVIVLGPAS